jgi:DNA-binding NtrC family response regulator
MTGIMIVDDEIDVLAVTKIMLERKGYDVMLLVIPFWR